MIVLDKHTENNYIYITIEGLRQSYSSTISLKATSGFSEKEFTTTLSTDLSSFQDRYSKYNISSDVFFDFEEGLYIYQVLEDEDVLLTGTIKIIDSSETDELIEIKNDDEAGDDYVIYENSN